MLIKIRVKTDSRKETVDVIAKDRIHISVREPAENNLANKRILEIIHGMYPDSRIRLIKGHHAPSKTVSVEV